ncbi:DUF742 domain-containing protein (plasmid) [Streptomyces sp. SDT5-1]|uniref:DUF742 domain-containing protein n=1 Tax=Streptomyces sp. SDT5-1 TaxID=3406418 RepID=UPI003FD5B410
MSGPRHDPDFVRPYVRTDGALRPARADVRVETLVKEGGGPRGPLGVDHHRVLSLVAQASGALAVADLAAALDLPPNTARILASELLDSGHLATPLDARTDQPDISVLQEVLDGLRAKVF